jgi:flagellar biosynthesis chaperone FliJ
MTGFVYRLQLLLERKEEAQKEAEREATRREEELQAQVKTLEELKQREQQLVEKRQEMRRNLLAKPGPGSDLLAGEVQQRSEYVKALKLQIEQAANDTLAQRGVVEACELKVEKAKQQAKEARREVEVLTKHRSRQEERFRREEQFKEDLALDEIGNVLFSTRRSST